MRNEIVQSLVVNSKNSVREITFDKYVSPFIVEGGALFKNGIKIGFCKDNEPCYGTLSSNHNKLLFFTNNKWYNININGILEYKNINCTSNTLELNLNINHLFKMNCNDIDFINVFFKINDTITENLYQNVELIFNNFNNDNNLMVNIKNDIPIIKDNTLIDTIQVNKNSIKILKLKFFNDIIIVE